MACQIALTCNQHPRHSSAKQRPHSVTSPRNKPSSTCTQVPTFKHHDKTAGVILNNKRGAVPFCYQVCCWRSSLEQKSSSKYSSLYKTGAYLLSTLGKDELEGIERRPDTIGTIISPREHFTSLSPIDAATLYIHTKESSIMVFKRSQMDRERKPSPSTRSTEAS